MHLKGSLNLRFVRVKIKKVPLVFSTIILFFCLFLKNVFDNEVGSVISICGMKSSIQSIEVERQDIFSRYLALPLQVNARQTFNTEGVQT